MAKKTPLSQALEAQRCVLDSLSSVVFVCDKKYEFVFLNSAALKALESIREPLYKNFGLKPSEILGGSIHRFHRDAKKIKKILQDPSRLPLKTTLTFGEVRLGAHIDSVRDSDGKVLGFCAQIDPVTEQRRLEDFRKLVDQLSDSIFIIDPKTGGFTDVNVTACKSLGYTRAQLLSKGVTDIATVVPDAAAWKAMSANIRAQGAKTIEGYHVRKDGSKFPVEVNASWVAADNEEFLIAIVRDVTVQRRTRKRLEESEKKTREHAQRLQEAREEERSAIAREIHDELGQSLIALKMNFANCLDKLPADAQELRAEAASMKDLIDRTIQETKRITTKLHPFVLDDLGLGAAVEWQNQEFQRHTGIRCTLRQQEGFEVDKGRSTAVFRIFQEALTNVARHAKASHVTTTLRKQGSDLILRVEDNGRGIGELKTAESGHYGIWGMRERALAWGGEVTFCGGKRKGTVVTLRLPLKKNGEAAS